MQTRFYPLILFAFLIISSVARAQDDPSQKPPSLTWITFGGGIGGNNDLGPLAVGITASNLSGVGLLSMRFVAGGRMDVNPAASTQHRLTTYLELSPLYGIASHSTFWLLSTSSGLGIIWLAGSGDRKFTTIGIPVEAQAFFAPLPVLAIGINLFGNINTKSSYGGFLFCFRFGRLR